ncbi:MAG: cytochrome c family protein [Gammaproteobacteria bacterium]|nr:cytochrome c family protein [Gammaproteobacteria bacterium]MCP5416986.1 cytochrome c family protein [Chromatiaceae bacterium]
MIIHNRWIVGMGVAAVFGWIGTVSELLADEPIHHLSSETCKTCHKEIYKQWKGSMHANSTALSDPIHGTFYQNTVGDPTKEGELHKASQKYPVCLECHAPNAARDKKTKLDALPVYSEGVNCIACHTLKSYKGIQAPDGKLQLGMKSYELTDTLQGPGRYSNRKLAALTASTDIFGGGDSEAKPNPHLGEPVTMDGKEIPALPMESNPKQLKTSDACMGCHDQRNNPHGVPLCQTGNEYSMSNSQVNCLSCHMPVNDGLVDHSMGGGHDLAILQRSVVFDVAAEKKGDILATSVSIRNMQPHSLPTGAPFRNIQMLLTAYDSSGNAVWRNAEGHPAQSDPQAYFVYELADDEGKPAGPPVATRLGKDTRLKPHEERKLVYEIPAKDVVLVRGELYYNLLWAGLVKKFSHLPEDLTASKLIASSEVSL